MKPSFVPIMNRADLLVLVGFDCEHAFLPALLEASKNPRIQVGKPGYVDASVGILPRMYPSQPITTRATFIPTATRITCSTRCWQRRRSGTSTTPWWTFAPQHQAEFTRNRDAYLAKLDAKIAEWKKEVIPLKGVKFVSYHEHWPYFADRFGMDYFGTIELKPGIDPTPRHIEDLIASDEGRACFDRRARAAVPRKGAETHRRADRGDYGNAAHNAGRRTQHGNLHQDGGRNNSWIGRSRTSAEDRACDEITHEKRCAPPVLCAGGVRWTEI